MSSMSQSPRRRRRVARLVALTTLLAFVAVSAAARRSSIKRRLPESREMRPFPTQTQESLVEFVAATGRVRLILGADAADAADRGYHIDNVMVVKKADYGVPSVDDIECFQFEVVRPLPFDVDSPPPFQGSMALFEPFDNGVPAGWELDRACWDGDLSAPRSVPEDSEGTRCGACCGPNGPTDACGPEPLRPFNCGPLPVFVDTNQRRFIFLDPEAGCTIPVCPGPACACPQGWETCATDNATLEPLACCPTEDACNQPRKWPGGSIALNTAGCETPAQEGDEATASILLTGLEPGEEYIVQFWWGAGGLLNIRQNEELFVDVTDVAVPDRTLTVQTDGAGSGSVTSSPAGIDCPGDCAQTYPEDTVVGLTATPDAGSTFAGWSGGGCSGSGGCSVALGADTTVTATFEPAGAGCTPDATTLCLPGDGRFAVSVRFETVQGGGRMGNAQAIPLDSQGLDLGGIFAFVNPANPEFLVKVLDGCAVNGHYWVFYAATTNIGFELTVVDTQTPGAVQTYTNPDVHPALTVTDTRAFATCP